MSRQQKETLLNKIQRQTKPYYNTLVLFGFEVYQLIEVIDGKDDLYYVTHSSRGIVWQSCVMGFTPLKGHIKKKDYKDLVRTWNMNTKFWDALEKPIEVK